MANIEMMGEGANLCNISADVVLNVKYYNYFFFLSKFHYPLPFHSFEPFMLKNWTVFMIGKMALHRGQLTLILVKFQFSSPTVSKIPIQTVSDFEGKVCKWLKGMKRKGIIKICDKVKRTATPRIPT